MAGIVDYNEKMADIKGDYNYARGAHQNVKVCRKSRWYEAKPDDDVATAEEKKGGRDNLLSQMGNIAEHCLKYFYKLSLLKDHPEISLEQFERIIQLQSKSLKSIYSETTAKDIAGKDNRIQSSTATTPEDYGPAAHDLQHILATIIDKYYPNTKTLINDLQIEAAKSKLIKQMTVEDYNNVFGGMEEDHLKLELFPYYCFPSLLFESVLVVSRSLETAHLDRIRNQLHDRYLVLEQARDAFTRFRYYNENKERKVLDVDEVYFMTKGFLDAAEMTHLSGDNLDINPQVAFARYYLETHPKFRKKWIQYSDENINKIFEIEEIKNNAPVLATCLFSTNGYLSPEEIKKIVTSPEIDEDDYIEIIEDGLTLDTIKFFRDNGIYKYDTMQSELLGGKTTEDRLIAMIFRDYSSLEDYKKQREQLSLQSGELVYNIIDNSFDENALITIRNEHDTYRYIANKEFSPHREYFFSSELVNELLKIDELRENKEAWFGLDLNQLLSFEFINKALYHSDRIDDLMKKENILSNIKANIERFKHNPKMLSYIPLMVNASDISQIYELLKSYNLTDEQIMKIDSSVFCMPVNFLRSFQLFGPYSDFSVIKDGALNPRIINKVKNRCRKNEYESFVIRDKVIVPYEESENKKLEQALLIREEREQQFGRIKYRFNQVFATTIPKKPQF